MKKNVILRGSQAAHKLIQGADLLADTVKATLGPWGGNVISGVRGNVIVTNDGKRIADLVNSEDEIMDLGIRAMREALSKTNDKAGDGTTSAITFAQAILKAAREHMASDTTFKGRISPIALRNMIHKEAEALIASVKRQARPVESEQELIDVARVSVEDEALAALIGSTQWGLGKDGTIIPEESNDAGVSVERINGVRVDNGYGTTLVLNNLEKQTLELNNCRVILTNYVLAGNKGLEPLSKLLGQLGTMGVTDVVIVARAFSSEVVQICMENHKKGFRIYPINAPYTDQAQVMKDLAAVLGAQFVDNEDMRLESLQLSGVGVATKLVSERFTSIFTGADDDAAKERVAKRIKELEDSYTGSQSEFEKKNLEARISQLKNGFALMKVGGKSLVERKYLFDKIEDCCHSVKAALQEGTVEGGGIALMKAGDELPDGALLKEATRSINEQISLNAGEPMRIPEWVRDPVKVVRIGIEAASSVAAQFATAVAAINVKNEKPRYVQEAQTAAQEDVQ